MIKQQFLSEFICLLKLLSGTIENSIENQFVSKYFKFRHVLPEFQCHDLILFRCSSSCFALSSEVNSDPAVSSDFGLFNELPSESSFLSDAVVFAAGSSNSKVFLESAGGEVITVTFKKKAAA